MYHSLTLCQASKALGLFSRRRVITLTASASDRVRLDSPKSSSLSFTSVFSDETHRVIQFQGISNGWIVAWRERKNKKKQPLTFISLILLFLARPFGLYVIIMSCLVVGRSSWICRNVGFIDYILGGKKKKKQFIRHTSFSPSYLASEIIWWGCSNLLAR